MKRKLAEWAAAIARATPLGERLGVPVLSAAALLFAVSATVAMRPVRTPAPPLEAVPQNPFALAVAGNGIVEAARENVAVGVPSPALVTSVAVQVSDSVQKGQTLFRLDDRELRAELVTALADVQVQEATVARLEDQWRRLQSVEDPRAVSVDERTTRQNDVKVAQAQWAASRARVRRIQALIDRLTVRAPRDGTVLQVNIRDGEYASAQAAVPAVLLGDLSSLQVRVDIDETNAARVRPGLSAVASPRNQPDRRWPLTFVRFEPYVVPKQSLTGEAAERVDTRVLQVIYRLERTPDYPLYAGQQMDVFIQAEGGV